MTTTKGPQTMNDAEAHANLVRAGVAWTGTGFAGWLTAIGLHDWGDVAAFLAAIYSLFLIIDWIRRRIFRRRQLDDESGSK